MIKYVSKKTIAGLIIFLVVGIFAICVRIDGIADSTKTFSYFLGAALKKADNFFYNRQKEDQAVDSTSTLKLRIANLNDIYFRPSQLKPINNNFLSFEKFNETFKNSTVVPRELLLTPQDTIINYFSVLQQAENLTEQKKGGCGTVGFAKEPFPIAYNFLSKAYQHSMPYDTFLTSFEGVGHTNLIKVIPVISDNPDQPKYFVELEVLEGTPEGSTSFNYYFGDIILTKSDGQFYIDSVQLAPEDFLCAAYHGWSHYAESYVDTVYGKWCNLIKKQYAPKQDDFKKEIYVDGNDGKKYLFVFARLTNGTDVQISTLVKQGSKYVPVVIDVEKCLDKDKVK